MTDKTNIPPNAVSLYGQNEAMDDFPVLKAFQQYIDAEQAKAQKRMLTLCIFFAIILTIVIGVFVLLLLNLGHRNTSLNDQLLKYVMSDRDRAVAVAQPQNNEATVKFLTDSISSLQKQMTEQQVKLFEQQSKLLEAQTKAAEEKMAKAMPLKEKDDATKKANDEKLKKAVSLLAAEKEKLAKEKEALRQEKLELQRRRLYPEHYQKKEAVVVRKKEAVVASKKEDVEIIDDDIDELDDDGAIQYFSDEEEDAPKEKVKAPSKKVTKVSAKKVQEDFSLPDWDIPLE